MKSRHVLTTVGLTILVLGLGTGLAFAAVGCGAGEQVGMVPSTEGTGVSVNPVLPPIDVSAPKDFQTATFAFG